MIVKKIVTIILTLGFSLALMDMGLWTATAGIPPGAKAQQESTQKKDEEKKEEEKNKKEEKKEKKLKRVWTDKDLEEIRKERLNITEVSPEPDEKKKEEKKNITDSPDLVKDKIEGEKLDPKKTEKYWRDRKKALVDKIKAYEKQIEKMEKILFQQKMQTGGKYSFTDKRIIDTYNYLENLKKDLEKIKQELEDLYDEARKAGALPGWLRD